MNGRNDIIRKRRLLEDPYKENICLNDLLMELSSLSKDLASIEVHDEPGVLRRSLSDLRKFEKSVNLFKHRLMDEVRPEVLKAHGERPIGKPRGVPFQKKEE